MLSDQLLDEVLHLSKNTCHGARMATETREPVPARLVILMGLQASGKSSFARACLADGQVILSTDAWPNARNKQRRMISLLRGHLAAGEAVAVDNTNPAPEDRHPLIEIAI